MGDLLAIESKEGDDPSYMEAVANLIVGALRDRGFDQLALVRVDGWFDRKWLGFEGNGLVMEHTGWRGLYLDEFRRGSPTAPPFSPSRIEDESGYRWCAYNERFIAAHLPRLIHRRQPSSRNLRRFLQPPDDGRLYAWYSGRTGIDGRGSLLLYAVREGTASMSYVSFDEDHGWAPHAAQGMSLAQVQREIDLGAERRQVFAQRVPSEEQALTACLASAVRDGRLADVAAAVTDEVELSRPDSQGETPLLIAILAGRWEIARYLVKAGANPFQRSVEGLGGLHACVLSSSRSEGRIQFVRELMNARVQLEARDEDGYTPLLLAVACSDEDMVEELIAGGADVHAKLRTGAVPLHVAAARGELGILTRLLDAGAKVSSRMQLRISPLLESARCGHGDCLAELHRRGASLEAKSSRGVTAVAIAEYNGHSDVVQLIQSLQGQ